MLIIAFETNKEVVELIMTSLLQREAKIIDLPQVVRRRTLGIVKDVKLNVEARLNHLLDGLSENVANALFEEMWALDEQDTLRHHFNVMRALKLQSDLYRKEFFRLMDEVWLTTLDQSAEHVLNEPQGIASTLINSYKSKTESHYRVLIRDFRLRFFSLISHEVDGYPLCPEVLYLCFWQSIEKLDLRYDERMMLLPLFQRFVMDRYGQLVAIANDTLIDHAIESEPMSVLR